MILKRAEIRNIKSYYPLEEIDFDESINIFIGPNGGGKSNLFEIIQSALNNLLFKHVTLKHNDNRRSSDHPHKDRAYVIEFDTIDNNSLLLNVFDKHFSHPGKPSDLQLIFKITSDDVASIANIVANKEKVIDVLKKRVAGSEVLLEVLNKLSVDVNFDNFIDKEMKIGFFTDKSISFVITNHAAFPNEEHPSLDLFFEITQYLNVFHEISMLFSEINTSPLSRYFGPHRTINQPRSNIAVNLTTLGSFEDNYSKGTNATKESSSSSIDGSYVKLCQLIEQNSSSIVDSYKKYLRKYLNIDVSIHKVEEIKYAFEYEIDFKRLSGVPMKLSSGEKEFFNLISGLVLSGIRNGVVLLDEPELHLHSQWQQVIIDIVGELAQEFKIQFFIVTHSSKFVNQHTLSSLYRVSMTDQISIVTKPADPTGNSQMKDLVQFLNSTNCEKIFFAHRVILVEGVSDQIIFDFVLKNLKRRMNSDIEVEVIQVGSKYNLHKFRKLLTEWKIDSYIIADLDYIREINNESNEIVSTASLRTHIKKVGADITKLFRFADSKMRKILCTLTNLDNKSLVDLISSKRSFSKKEFHQKIDELTEYLISERATVIDKSIQLSSELILILERLASEEKIFVLEKGEIEDYYSIASNKIENALEVTKILNMETLDSKIKSFLERILT